MKILALIPARYQSSRFPGKPLADIGGKPMIQRVYEQSKKAFEYVYVATDDDRIFDCVKSFDGKAVMTSENHQSGTDRCYEALLNVEAELGIVFDIVVNVQGDEPFIAPEQLLDLVGCFDDSSTEIATLIKRFDKEESVFNPNSPKVVINKNGDAMYFSRSAIPFDRDSSENFRKDEFPYYKHIGLYAYRRETLIRITKLEQSYLEKMEKLEQLRWLEEGIKIKTAKTTHNTFAVDTPEDLETLKNMGLY